MRITSSVGSRVLEFEPGERQADGKLSFGLVGSDGPAQEVACRRREGGVEVCLRPGSPAVWVPLPDSALEELRGGAPVRLPVRGHEIEVKLAAPRPGQARPAKPPARAAAPATPRPAAASSTAGPRAAGGVYPPMPGNVVKILVAPGDRVAAGDLLLVLEAMKMQNEVRAPQAGVVTRLGVEVGQKVDKSTLLAVVEG